MSQEQATTQKINIDGQEYAVSDLNEKARNLIVNLRVAEQELARLQQQTALVQTARMAYANALKAELPVSPSAPEDKFSF